MRPCPGPGLIAACGRVRRTCHSSVCSPMRAPTKRRTDASLGKMPTTRDRRLISRFSRSIGFVLAICGQCSCGNDMNSSTSSSARSMRSCTFGNRVPTLSADSRHCLIASAWVSCTKAVRITAATIWCWGRGTWASALRMKWTRHLCHAHPINFAMAAVRPS